MPSSPLILLSFDAEEFDLPLEFGRTIEPARQMDVAREGLRRVLDLLAERRARATLFVTGAVARACPDLVREAAGAGHEIASHGMEHGRFEVAHLGESRGLLESISGAPVRGFRRARLAPTDPRAVAAAGYTYSASENPIWLPGRYNGFFAQRRAYVAGDLVHIPASATPLVRWPLFWLAFKNVPRWVTRAATATVLAADGYAALYFHPWELCDLREFRLPRGVAGLSGARYTRRLGDYIEWLARRGRFATYGELAEQVRSGARPARRRRP